MDGHDGHGGDGLGHASFDHGAGGHFGLSHDVGHSGEHAGHVLHEAVVFSFSHGGHGHGHSDYGASIAHSHGTHHEHHSPGALSRQGMKPNELDGALDNAENARTFVVHVAGHGHVEQMGCFYRIALDYDLIRLDDRRPNFEAVAQTKFEIADWNIWGDLAGNGTKPSGYRDGFTGRTTFTKQFWQIGKRKRFWNKPQLDNKAMTCLEVAFVVWHFDQTADYETVLLLRVVSYPVYDHKDGQWGFKKIPFEKHQRVARKVAERIFETLRSIKSPEGSRLLREYYASHDVPKPVENVAEADTAPDKIEDAMDKTEVDSPEAVDPYVPAEGKHPRPDTVDSDSGIDGTTGEGDMAPPGLVRITFTIPQDD